MRYFLLISLFLLPTITLASGGDPWCLIRDENEVCGFKTAQECYAKSQYGGYCRENHRFMGVSEANRRWCVVTASRRDCKYARKGCLKAAIELGGGCVENTEQALKRARAGSGWGSKGEDDEDDDFDFDE